MVERGRLRTGSLHGGAHGTRVHPDTASEQQDRRMRALQKEFAGEDTPMGRATVERGRTVECPVPDKKQFVRYDKDGNSVYGPVYSHFGPGEVVTLPLTEIERLTVLGFLVDPDKKYKTQKDIVKNQGRKTDEPRSRIINSDSRPGPVVNSNS